MRRKRLQLWYLTLLAIWHYKPAMLTPLIVIAYVLLGLSCGRMPSQGETTATNVPARTMEKMSSAVIHAHVNDGGATNVDVQVHAFEQTLGVLRGEIYGSTSLSAMIASVRTTIPYEQRRQLAWNYRRAYRTYDEAECVVSALWTTAKSIDARHEAMVILGFAAVEHNAYQRGIDQLTTIVQEQRARTEPSARHLVGAYQNLAALYGLNSQWKESVDAAHCALEWWDKETPQRRTCSRTGVEVMLAESLANAGEYGQAHTLLNRLIKEGAIDSASYDDSIKTIEFYEANPHSRDWTKAIIGGR